MYIPTYLKVFVCIVFLKVNFHVCKVTTLVIVMLWCRDLGDEFHKWLVENCSYYYTASSLLEQKKNLFWRLPSWVNLLSLFLVKNEDVSVWFNIIWLGMQIEIRVKYQGWWKFYILKNLSSIGYSHRYRKNSNKKRVIFWT